MVKINSKVFRKLVRRAFGTALISFVASALSLLLLYRYGVDAITQEVRYSLIQLAETAAIFVDGDLHKTFISPAQEKSPEYQKAVAPLRTILNAHPEIRFLYTMILHDGKPCFVLDATPPGDVDHDGVEDHSPIMQPYETPAAELMKALTSGTTGADANPVTDQWGTYLSGYAPFHDSHGRYSGIVGVDLKLDRYAARLADMRRALVFGLSIAASLSLLIGLGVWWLGRRAVRAEKRQLEADEAARRSEVEMKGLEVQLRQAHKMESVGRLAGGVAHDFNNMLGVILGHAELVLEQVDPAGPLHANLEAIHKAAERSATLTQQLLAFARKQPIAPKVLALNEVVAGMLKLLPKLVGEDVHLAWAPSVGLWPVKMDPSQIDQIIANLCVNARDAIGGVGTIILQTKNITIDADFSTASAGVVPGDYVLLTVSDNGCGMDKETQAHLFEPYFTTKGLGKGTGLGLATVYGIVKQNNGFINVYSEAGKGTTFKIYLPKVAETVEKTIVASKVEAPKGRGETVLLVEDEKSLRMICCRYLETFGYKVLLTETAEDAVKLAGQYPGDIHLLLTDVVMPGMNGRSLAQQVCAVKPGIKVLFMSGYPADVIAQRGVLEQNMEFISKPFTRNELTCKVHEILKTREGAEQQG